MEKEKVELFETIPISKAVYKLATPTVLSCLVMILYNLADTFFVGLLNDSVQTSAVTIGATLILAFNAITNLFGSGASSLMSRALGVKDYKTFSRTSSISFYCSLACSVLLSIAVWLFNEPVLNIIGAVSDNMEATAAYLKWTVVFGAVPAILNVVLAHLVRAEGETVHSSIGTMSGCVINMILDPIMILPQGLNMGAEGAGLATCISNTIACLYFFILLGVKGKKTYVSIRIRDFVPSRTIMKEVFGVGVPASIQNILNVVGMTVLNKYTSEYGTAAVSAIGIAHKITMVPMYISMGIAQGVMPLIGYNFSAGNRKRMRDAVRFTSRTAIGFITLASAVMYFTAGVLIAVFMDDPLVIEYGEAFMHGMCIAQPLLAIDFLGVGVFQACGMGRMSLIFAIKRKILLEIPALVVLNKLFPMYGIAYAQLVAEAVLAVISYITLRKILETEEK